MDNVRKLPPVKVDLSGSDLHRHIVAERGGYLDRLHPQPAIPDWSDVEAVMQWIEGTRWRAFFAGARHEEISRAEAVALVAALQSEGAGT